MLNRLEQVDKCFMACIYTIGSLICGHKDIHVRQRKVHTASRTASPACIAFEGGNACKSRQRYETPHQCVLTYQADGPSKCGVGGEGRKDRDGTFDQFHDSILPPEITEMLCLELEERCDGLDTVAVLELGCKWVLG